MTMYLEKIDGASNPANMLTKCVNVGTLRFSVSVGTLRSANVLELIIEFSYQVRIV